METVARLGRIAVAYLARGGGSDWQASFQRFVHSYVQNAAGLSHSLYVLFKGFADEDALAVGRGVFSEVVHTPIFLDDTTYDIGAYLAWAEQIPEDVVCPMNTFSEILSDCWLLKLARNLAVPNVGCVGATGSYESSRSLDDSVPHFPNVHLRTNAFMMRRQLFLDVGRGLHFARKLDAHLFESGPQSLTRQVLARKLNVIVVGRNGRGYAPASWPRSDTFRQRDQANLLVSDNQTRDFESSIWDTKRTCAAATWGRFLAGDPAQFPMSQP